MAILKTYLDDSGNPSDQNCTVLTVSGYQSDIEGWRGFERMWGDVLDTFEVPYLHMKEFGDKNGLYKHIKSDPLKEAAFMGGLIDAIFATVDFCPMGTIRLRELEQFNSDHSLNLDPYAVVIYGCLMELAAQHRWKEIDVVFDKFDKAPSRVELAFEYARTDKYFPVDIWDLFTPTTLQKDESFKDIRQIQAADFVSWEMRRALEDRREWQFPSAGRNRESIAESYRQFVEVYVQKYGARPRERKTMGILRRGSPPLAPVGYIWDRVILEEAHKRHPNGWTL